MTMTMTPLRLSLCLYLLASCSARPNWHHHQGDDNPLLQKQNQQATFESPTSNEHDKAQRSARQTSNSMFFGASFSLGGNSHVNNHPPFPFIERQNFGPPLNHQQFGPPLDHQEFGPPLVHQPFGPSLDHREFGPPSDHQQFGPPQLLHPIKQLATTLQNIVSSHLEATVQHNKAVHFGALDNIFHHPAVLPPPCPMCNVPHTFSQSQSFEETSHHLEVGPPSVISNGVHMEHVQITCEGSNCRDIPTQVHPTTQKPPHTNTEFIEEMSKAPPSSEKPPSTERQEHTSNNEADIFYGNDDKDAKTFGSDNEAGIDIRFGGSPTTEETESR